MPLEHPALRSCAMLAACGLAVAACPLHAQSDPLTRPYEAVVNIDQLPGGAWRALGPGPVSDDDVIAGLGDINGDGLDDVSVLNGRISSVVYGHAGGPTVIDLLDLPRELGFSMPDQRHVAPMGDINGDGLDDFGLSDQYIDGPGGAFRAGRAYVVFGREGGFPGGVRLTELDGANGFEMVGQGDKAHLGGGIGAAGDLNGDGVDDLLVSARGRRLEAPGALHIIFGRSQPGGATFPAQIVLDEPDGDTRVRFDGSGQPDWHGPVAALGDVNGDGRDDVAVVERGNAYVLFGRGPGEPWPRTLGIGDLDGTNGFTAGGLGLLQRVARAGDFNGDGLGDLVLGLPSASPGGRTAAGLCVVLFGADGPAFPPRVALDALAPEAGFVLEGVNGVFPSEDLGDRAGYSIAGPGDVNGDGFEDVLIGAPGGDYTGTPVYGRGEAYLIFGRRELFTEPVMLGDLDGRIGVTLHGGPSASAFGSCVRAAGDFNGDGRPDMLLGTRRATTPGLGDQGGSYIVLGRTVCAPDLDGDGALTLFDFLAFQNLFDSGSLQADFDGDGELTIFDFLAFQTAFDAGCP